MRSALRWVGVGVLALLGVLLAIVAVFWFTTPRIPNLPDDFAATVPPDTTVTDPDLRVELLAMRYLDQAVRDSSLVATMTDLDGIGGLWRVAQQSVRLMTIDEPNTERLQAIVARHGWPTRAEVGADGREALFLLVQHADQNPSFQAEALGPMREAYEAGDAEGAQLALLTDRVRVAQGAPQVYGSQVVAMPGEPPRLRPIEDSTRVDERRAELGLPPLAVYLDTLCEEAGLCVER